MMAAAHRSSREPSPKRSTCPARHGRRNRGCLPWRLEAGAQGAGHLPRRVEAQPAAIDQVEVDKAADKTRHRQPAPRTVARHAQSITHKFNVAGHEGYITVGLYPDGRPGELFITMAKEGSTVGGLMDAFGTAISICLQYGVPFEVLVNKFSHTRLEPMGTKNPDIRSPRASWTISSAGWA